MYPSFNSTLWLILSGYYKTIKVHSALILLYSQMYVLDNTKTANETRNFMLFVFSGKDVKLSEQSLNILT
jgi:hypothetical protein